MWLVRCHFIQVCNSMVPRENPILVWCSTDGCSVAWLGRRCHYSLWVCNSMVPLRGVAHECSVAWLVRWCHYSVPLHSGALHYITLHSGAVLHGWGRGAITASHGVSVTRSLQASARGERLPLSSPELVCHLALNDWCHHYS